MVPILMFLAVSPRVPGSPSLVAQSSILPTGQSSFYVGPKAPLKAASVFKLPVGAIEPKGWIRTELVDEANGETGHLEEISPWLSKKNNAWLTKDGKGDHGWEEVPYWLKGFGDLGYVLKDKRIIDHAKVWIDAVLSSQRPNGWLGPESNLTANDGKPDMWPNMPMLFALQSYYDWSKDPRIIPAMTRYFHWQLALPDKLFYTSYWEKHRGGDNMASVYWLYNRTGSKFLLELARKIHRCNADWVSGVANWHGVNFAQAFREPEEFSQLDHSVPGAQATEADYSSMRDLYGQVPGGMYGADENARPGFHDPRQGTETCAMVEMMLSDELLLEEDGDTKWAERCEDVALNDLPAALTADEEALHYLTAPNLVVVDAKNKAPGFENSGPMLLFNPYDHRCCQHNVSHGWPYYAEHLWMATAGNGLVAELYAPSRVTAKVGKGSQVSIEESTEYPFRDAVRLTIHASHPTQFPLSFRVPSWTPNPSARINGTPVPIKAGGGYATLNHRWADGDSVLLTFPMKIRLHEWAQNGRAVSVERGPLSYALQIGQERQKSMGTKEWPATAKYPAWEVHPTTAWNYGLDPDLSKFKAVEIPFDGSKQPFELSNVPVEIKAPAREIEQWKIDSTGLVARLQNSPAYSAEPLKMVTLVPMGAERLRISEFPTVSNSLDAQAWATPAVPHAPLPTQSSHTFSADTTDAMSNGLTPSSSGDLSIPRFTWWDHRGTAEWVEYDLPEAKLLSGVEVYWFDDGKTGGGCRPPTSCTVSTYVDGEWKDIPTDSPIGLRRDQFNRTSFSPVLTNRIRLTAKLRPGFSSGILQWRLISASQR